MLYLVPHPCFFDSRLYYSIFIYNEKNNFFYKTPFLSIKSELAINSFASRLLMYRK